MSETKTRKPTTILLPSKKGLLYLVENPEENRLYFGDREGQLDPDSLHAQYVLLRDLRKLNTSGKMGYVAIDRSIQAKRTWTGKLKIRRGISHIIGLEYTLSRADSKTIEPYLK